MDISGFVERLPGLYQQWGEPSVQPSSDSFREVLGRVKGMTSSNVLQLLNCAVGCLEDGEVYGEIGCFQGASLIGALLGNANRLACAADNFAEFDPKRENEAALMRNLEAFHLRAQVRFEPIGFEEFLLNLRGSATKLGVYFYDGAHDYRSQLLGLLLAVPLLAKRALIVIDDSNWPAVRQATWDFLAAHSECRVLFELPTPANRHPSFWNGLLVLAWEQATCNGYDWRTLRSQRQPALLESIYALQAVNLKIERGRIRIVPAK